MPIYTYICPKCKEEDELIQKFGEPAPSCSICNDTVMEKVPTFGGFVLKGSGWYRDGYKTKSNKREDDETKSE